MKTYAQEQLDYLRRKKAAKMKKDDTTLDGTTNKLYKMITKEAAKELINLGEARYWVFGGRILKGFLHYEGNDYELNKKLKAYELKK